MWEFDKPISFGDARRKIHLLFNRRTQASKQSLTQTFWHPQGVWRSLRIGPYRKSIFRFAEKGTRRWIGKKYENLFATHNSMRARKAEKGRERERETREGDSIGMWMIALLFKTHKLVWLWMKQKIQFLLLSHRRGEEKEGETTDLRAGKFMVFGYFRRLAVL